MSEENLKNMSMFILRLVIGAIFVVHGSQKLFGMFNGIGLEGTINMLESLNVHNARVFAVIWGSIEFVCGLFLIMGIFARWSAGLILFSMVVYFSKMSLMYGFFFKTVGLEYNFLIIGSCLPIILMGGGSWALWDI